MRLITNTARIISLAVSCLLVANTALADVAPPNMPPGSNPSPDAQTKVQMSAESITITVQEIPPPSYARLVGDLSFAQVDGVFSMRNRGTAAESMQVRFPLADPSGRGSGFFTYPEVQNFSASVDGELKPISVISLTNPSREQDPPIRWAAFDVTFPATRTVVISVSYSISPTGYLPEAVFAYVLSTGAGWNGPIGKADITLRLPYTPTFENVVLSKSAPGAYFTGNALHWQHTNLEPTTEDDWFVTLISPNIWRNIIAARDAQHAAPRDAQKWLALSKAYIAAVPFKYEPMGGKRFLQLGIQAMRRAVSLAPNSAEMHVEYADLLWYLYYFDVVQNPQGATAKTIYTQLNLALKLDPNNARALALKAEIDRETGQAQGLRYSWPE